MKNDLKELKRYVNLYKTVCGVIKEDDVLKIVKFYNLDLTDKEIRDAFLEEFEYVDGYYTVNRVLVNDDYLKSRNGLSIRLLTDEEFSNYSVSLSVILSLLGKIIDQDKVEKILSQEVVYGLFTNDINDNDLSSILDALEISKNDYKEICKVFDEYGYLVRYNCYYGRTMEEYDLDILLDTMIMRGKPKNNTIEEFLSLLDDSSRKDIFDFYDIDYNNLEELIMTIEGMIVPESSLLTREEYNAMVNSEFSYDISDASFLGGFVFNYMEDGVRKIVVPDEIKDVLDSINPDELDNDYELDDDDFKDEDLDELSVDDYIVGYISINGVIEIEHLRDLLDDRHDILLTCDDIVDIATSYNNVHEYKDKYLTVLYNDDIIDKLLEVKRLNDDYQTFTYDISKIEQEFVSAIREFVDDTFDDEDKIKYIYGYIYQTLKLGVYSNKTLDALVYEENLSKNEQKKINEFCKKYKKCFGR